VDKQLREELVRDEGCRLKAYRDTNGFWTIGIGHLLGATARMTEITLSEAYALLEADIRVAEDAVNAVFPEFSVCDCTHQVCEADRVRKRALINMAFNRGEGNMRSSTTITPAIKAAIVSKDWSKVGSAILASPWGKQIGTRANRLAQMLETGDTY